MLWLVIYLALVNAVAFTAFAFDKAAAQAGNDRIPERTLLLLAALGGSPGAIIGQQVLRHKTRKEPFRTLLLVVAGLQLAAVAAGLLLRP